jgi:hypothetical protein
MNLRTGLMSETLAPDDLVQNHACPIWMRITAWNLACPFQSTEEVEKRGAKPGAYREGAVPLWCVTKNYIYVFPTTISVYMVMNRENDNRPRNCSVSRSILRARRRGDTSFIYKNRRFYFEKPECKKPLKRYIGT